MEYKLIYGVIHYDEYGEIHHGIIQPMLFDARHTKTRDKVINTIKQTMVNMISDHCENRFDRGPITDIIINDIEETNYILDRCIDFNITNDLKKVAKINYSEEDNELWLYGFIYETTPELFKSPESELNMLSDKASLTQMIDNMYSNTIFNYKDIFFISYYAIMPDYDTEDRYDYVGGFKSISKNLYDFLKKEQKDFITQAKSFMRFIYDDAYVDVDEEFNNINIVNRMSMTNILKRNGQSLHDIIRSGINIAIEDRNGLYVYNDIQIVPLVSYTGR